MNLLLNEKINELLSQRQLFAIATVFRVFGSASARVGSKAVITAEGKNLIGWIGGGCAERFVCEQAVLSIQERKSRIVEADLDDEIFGLGVACGGRMEIFIEPVLPSLTISLLPDDPLTHVCQKIGMTMGILIESTNAIESANSPTRFLCEIQNLDRLSDSERAVLGFSLCLANRKNILPLLLNLKELCKCIRTPRATKPLPRNFKLLVMGRSRITESLAFLAQLLEWPIQIFTTAKLELPNSSELKVNLTQLDSFSEVQFSSHDFVIIASHHMEDPEIAKKAIQAHSPYVAFVASKKRSSLVIDFLIDNGLPLESLSALKAPAGIELNAENPMEIALSIMSEIIILIAQKG